MRHDLPELIEPDLNLDHRGKYRSLMMHVGTRVLPSTATLSFTEGFRDLMAVRLPLLWVLSPSATIEAHLTGLTHAVRDLKAVGGPDWAERIQVTCEPDVSRPSEIHEFEIRPFLNMIGWTVPVGPSC